MLCAAIVKYRVNICWKNHYCSSSIGVKLGIREEVVVGVRVMKPDVV